MKQRYLKHIKFDLNSGSHRFPFLSPQDLKLLRQGFVSAFILFFHIYIYNNVLKIIFINFYFSLNIEKINKNDKEAIKSHLNEERFSNWESDSS